MSVLNKNISELVDAINSHVFDLVDDNINFHGNYEINYPVSQ